MLPEKLAMEDCTKEDEFILMLMNTLIMIKMLSLPQTISDLILQYESKDDSDEDSEDVVVSLAETIVNLKNLKNFLTRQGKKKNLYVLQQYMWNYT